MQAPQGGFGGKMALTGMWHSRLRLCIADAVGVGTRRGRLQFFDVRSPFAEGHGARSLSTSIRGTTRNSHFERLYANSSLITLPPLAIFIGRLFLLVNDFSSETPSAFSTEAITSSEV